MELGGSRSRDSWAGLTLGAVLGTDAHRSDSIAQVSRTLLDIIRDEESDSGAYKNLVPDHNKKKNWLSFTDRLRLRKTDEGRISSVDSPTSSSDSPTLHQNDRRSFLSQPTSYITGNSTLVNAGDVTRSENVYAVRDLATQTCRPQITQVSSLTSMSFRSHLANELREPQLVETLPAADLPVRDLRNQMLQSNTSGLHSQSDEPVAAPSIRLSAALAAEREQQIQRVVSSIEAETRDEEAETTVEEEYGTTEAAQQPARMSLMELLEETNRQMGWTSYSAGYVEEEEHNNGGGGLSEHNCCVCMVRHKGAAFIPCGHTFCRVCSRELWVNRGNCPLCNSCILEILDIF